MNDIRPARQQTGKYRNNAPIPSAPSGSAKNAFQFQILEKLSVANRLLDTYEACAPGKGREINIPEYPGLYQGLESMYCVPEASADTTAPYVPEDSAGHVPPSDKDLSAADQPPDTPGPADSSGSPDISISQQETVPISESSDADKPRTNTSHTNRREEEDPFELRKRLEERREQRESYQERKRRLRELQRQRRREQQEMRKRTMERRRKRKELLDLHLENIMERRKLLDKILEAKETQEHIRTLCLYRSKQAALFAAASTSTEIEALISMLKRSLVLQENEILTDDAGKTQKEHTQARLEQAQSARKRKLSEKSYAIDQWKKAMNTLNN